MESAVRFLQSRPFRDLTVGDLMAGTTLSRPAFYRYFADLHDLIEALLGKVEAIMHHTADPWISGEGEPIKALRESLRGVVRTCVDHGPTIRAVFEAAPLDERLERAWSAFMDGTPARAWMVRFFGGWDFKEDDLRSRVPAFIGYERGVPMGGDLRTPPRGAKAPTFMVYALRDPIGANLDRMQIVKGWLDTKGELHERVYDIAISGDRTIEANGRCRTPVGNTVEVEAANWTNTIGASELTAVWTDPDFDSKERAFYYVRVIEIPTPRWVLYDKVRLGAEIPEGAELIGQERAYTSPIWYTPDD